MGKNTWESIVTAGRQLANNKKKNYCPVATSRVDLHVFVNPRILSNQFFGMQFLSGIHPFVEQPLFSPPLYVFGVFFVVSGSGRQQE